MSNNGSLPDLFTSQGGKWLRVGGRGVKGKTEPKPGIEVKKSLRNERNVRRRGEKGGVSEKISQSEERNPLSQRKKRKSEALKNPKVSTVGGTKQEKKKKGGNRGTNQREPTHKGTPHKGKEVWGVITGG